MSTMSVANPASVAAVLDHDDLVPEAADIGQGLNKDLGLDGRAEIRAGHHRCARRAVLACVRDDRSHYD
jgi:hypothetical protein